MKITIEVPEMKCTKCEIAAPIQPRLLSFKGSVPTQFREVLSAVMKERPDVTAADDNGGSWSVMADEKPAGWVKGPGSSNLCAPCGALWQEAGKAFLIPSAGIVAPAEPTVAPAPPTKSQAPRAMTVSEIVATKMYENIAPSTNSMMPMTMPSLLKR